MAKAKAAKAAKTSKKAASAVGGKPEYLSPGGGARFWAYISPMNNTSQKVTDWTVIISQGNWTGMISSHNPYETLQTPGLSGIFDVIVIASGPAMPRKRLTVQAGSNPQIGCNSNCSSMVGIVANAAGTDANYWTTWDAFCS